MSLRALWPVLLFVLVVPGDAVAWGDAEVESDASFPEGVFLGGRSEVRAASGILDLSLPARSGSAVEIAWERATGKHVIHEAIERPAGRSQTGVRVEPIDLGPGTLRITECQERCEVVLFQDGAGALHAVGDLHSQVRWTKEGRAFSALVNQSGFDNTFYHPVEPGALVFTLEALTDTEGMVIRDGRIEAQGAFTLLIDDARAEFQGDAPRTVDTMERRESLAPGAPFSPLLHRVTSSFALLEVEGLVLTRLPGDRAVLYAGLPTLDLHGNLSAPSATGSLSVDGTPRTLRGEALSLSGAFEIAPRVASEELAILESGGTLRMRVQGDADRIRVGGSTVVDSPRDAAVAWSAAGLVTAALLAARLLVGPLYSRLDHSRVLGHPKRRAILDALAGGPGLTAPALARALGMGRAVAMHHLAMLESHRLVVWRRIGWERRYFVDGSAPDAAQVALHALLADDTRRRIAEAIARAPATQSSLVQETGARQRLVSYHLMKLEKGGLIAVADGRPRRYAATPMLQRALHGNEAAARPLT